jgi:hypothetical protein
LLRGVDIARDVKFGLLPLDEAAPVGVPRPISTTTLSLKPSENPFDSVDGIFPPRSGTLSLALMGNGRDSGVPVNSSICIGDSFKTLSSAGFLEIEIDGFLDFLTFSSGILCSSCGGSFFDIGLDELIDSPAVSSSRS